MNIFDILDIPPIFIPNDNDIVEKKYKYKYKSESYSYGYDWDLSIFEVWNEEDVYYELKDKFNDIKQELSYSIYNKDFSKKTSDKLEKMKQKITSIIDIIKKRGLFNSNGFIHKKIYKITDNLSETIKLANNYVYNLNKNK